jgi:hypothetical protein
MYTVNDKEYTSFFAAMAQAKETQSEVIEPATGLVRWTPPKSVTKKQLRMYEERKSAYAAQQRLDAMKQSK